MQRDPAIAKVRWIKTFQIEYRNRLRKAIRRDEVIPDQVLEQSEEIKKVILAEIKRLLKFGKTVSPKLQATAEYEKAMTGRRRYEKGWKTSHANVSIAIDLSLQNSHGVKVKRQDGTAIEDVQKTEIAEGLEELASIFGDRLFAAVIKTDLTICHTNGKCPFLNDAAGFYVPSERSISIGTILQSSGRKVRALAHEMAHWMDYEAGKVAGVETNITDLQRVSLTALRRGNYAKRTTFALSEGGYAARNLLNQRDDGSLIAAARDTINRAVEVRELMNITNKKEAAEKGKEKEYEQAKVRLGPYWTRPREIWARLVEQYVATVLGKVSSCAESPEFYTRTPGWWKSQDFKAIMPRIGEEINQRLSLCSGEIPPSAMYSPGGEAWQPLV
jgi:hypothetical protein